MIGAVICNGSNTMVIDLPTESLNLESKLLSIGIIEPAEKLLLSDEEGDQIRIKLYARRARPVRRFKSCCRRQHGVIPFQ